MWPFGCLWNEEIGQFPLDIANCRGRQDGSYSSDNPELPSSGTGKGKTTTSKSTNFQPERLFYLVEEKYYSFQSLLKTQFCIF